MTPEEFAKQIRAHAQELRRAYADRWPRMMRTEAIEHFHEGFRNGGFTDTSLEKWDVTRRQSVPFSGATTGVPAAAGAADAAADAEAGAAEGAAVCAAFFASSMSAGIGSRLFGSALRHLK